MTADYRDAAIISFAAVTKFFGDTPVLRELDLVVRRNEHIALMGPSGSGKSTILRILMTLEPIRRGSVIVDGDSLWNDAGEGSRMAPRPTVAKIRQKVGMVFQSFNLFPHMTAIRNIAEAPRRVLGMTKQGAFERARELLEMVGMSDKENNYPIQLSGGQQQRVAIARCLAMRPQILLFDEITSALDPETVGEVLFVVRQLATEHKFTIIMVTHQIDVARDIADRICVLDGGRIIEEGPPAKVIDEPCHDRTRAFLRAIKDA